jgi:protein TonB
MNATTINTFPPLQSMNSPRGWILALIVLLHFGFFVLLSSGMGPRILDAFRPPPIVVMPTKPEPLPTEPTTATKPVKLVTGQPLYVPEPALPEEPRTIDESQTGSIVEDTQIIHDGGQAARAPTISQPDFDPRVGFSEPTYPASEIRAGHTGTVLISIYVLENGRVGDVRLDQSSGYKRLDESAVREARRWRLKPGMRDGVPVAMWKQLPVTFQLQGSGSARF